MALSENDLPSIILTLGPPSQNQTGPAQDPRPRTPGGWIEGLLPGVQHARRSEEVGG